MLYRPPPLPPATGSAASPRRRLLRWDGPSGELSGCAASFLLHLILLLVLAYWHLGDDRQPAGLALVVPPYTSDEPPSVLAGAVVSTEAALGPLEDQVGDSNPEPVTAETPPIDLVLLPDSSRPAADVHQPATRFQPRDLLIPAPGAVRGGGYEGRDPERRARLALTRGGTAESEDAVARGLAWLAAHQRPDGSWRFDHRSDRCQGICRNPGTVASTTAATGLALLPFLGAGEVTEASPYYKTVERGLYYLVGRILLTPHGGDLQEGTMYAQGIATLTLCEALAMTDDPTLRGPAAAALEFICHAQHPEGGWRYYPGQPGDTTVFGWQIMALKSARLAGLQEHVPAAVLDRGKQFLDSVQDHQGASYGYMKAGREPTPTAVGLLARMYYGWPQDDPRLAAGVAYLEKLGPSRTDMYFNYYAHQVMHHYEGPGWEAWNRQLRDRLIATQSRQGHEHGSWYFNDPHAESGGRLYTTAMCLMILEVYYRHMPLYGQAAVADDF